MSKDILIGALALWVAFMAFVVIRGFIKGEGRFRLKQTVNDARWLLSFIWVMYFLVGAISIVPFIAEWTAQQADKWVANSATQLVVSWTPYVYIFTLLALVIWVISQSFKPWWKYNEEEEVKLKAEKQKNRERLQRWIPFIKFKKEV